MPLTIDRQYFERKNTSEIESADVLYDIDPMFKFCFFSMGLCIHVFMLI